MANIFNMTAPLPEPEPTIPARESTPRIEDHGLIGDMHTAALVTKGGSIDWLCLPNFDSEACFASLVGKPSNGHWTIAPTVPLREVSRR